MRNGGGKQKGASFERKICKDLSLWLSDGKRSDLLWRSAMSGGRSTVALAKGEKLSSQAGDISSIDAFSSNFISRWYIECKHLKTLDIASLLKGNGILASHWAKAKQDAQVHGKAPMLIAKQNNWPTIVCLSLEGVERIKGYNPIDITAMFVPRLDLYILSYDCLLTIDPLTL